METRNLDEKLKKALQTKTEVPAEAKEEIWKRINEQLSIDQEESISMKKRNHTTNYKKTLIKLVASVAAAAILLIGLQTQTGHALINQIKDMFVFEKDVIQDIEGIEEQINLELKEGKEASYVIYVDKERYKLISEEEADKIVLIEPPGGIYPEVSMEIRQETAKTPEELIKEIELELWEEFGEVLLPEQVESPVAGWMVIGVAGSQWDSPVKKVYLTGNGQEGSFVITQRYFLEAAEGHGVRFDGMLKEFYLVEQ